MPDVDFQLISTVQNATMPKPTTIASATTIAPVGFLTVVSGTAAIVTVTPPVTGAHMLVIIPTGAFTTTTAGNLSTAMTAAVNVPVLLFFNSNTNQYAVGEAIPT